MVVEVKSQVGDLGERRKVVLVQGRGGRRGEGGERHRDYGVHSGAWCLLKMMTSEVMVVLGETARGQRSHESRKALGDFACASLCLGSPGEDPTVQKICWDRILISRTDPYFR